MTSVNLDDIIAARQAELARKGQKPPTDGKTAADLSIMELVVIWFLLTVLIVMKVIAALIRGAIHVIEVIQHALHREPARGKRRR